MTEARAHGTPIPHQEDLQGLPHVNVTRLALEVLWNELFYRRSGKLEPEEEAVGKALDDLHEMLWDEEMQAVAETGLTSHYLVIRPIDPLNIPGPEATSEIGHAIGTLLRHGMIARDTEDGWGTSDRR
jgi:hypothetical protein